MLLKVKGEVQPARILALKLGQCSQWRSNAAAGRYKDWVTVTVQGLSKFTKS